MHEQMTANANALEKEQFPLMTVRLIFSQFIRREIGCSNPYEATWL